MKLAKHSMPLGELATMNNRNSNKTRSSVPSSRGKSRNRTRLPPGTVVVRYKELLGTVTKGTSRFLFIPGSSGLSHLDARGRMYEMYRLRGPVKIQYRAAVGATANGEVLIGVDYDAKDAVLSYEGTAALSPKSMTPVWRDSTLSVPHNRAMKQKWLVTATDIAAPRDSAGVPNNYRDDAVAFGLNITSTGENNTGSVWVEYNIEFASPRQPEPVVNAAVYCAGSVGNGAHASLNGRDGLSSPVPSGGTFYTAVSSGFQGLKDGYTQLETGETDGVQWRKIKRDAESAVWGELASGTNKLVTVFASASLAALIRAVKNATIA